MYENENLVAEATENAENTAEQTPAKISMTQDELNEIVGKAKARERAKITKQYERQNAELNELVDTLRAGTGKESVGEMNSTFKEFYESKGIKINKTSEQSQRDIETLARADANEIIGYGDEEAAEEFDRLEALGTKMTKREQETFRILAEHLQSKETSRQLAKIGVPEKEYNSPEFKEFRKMFNSDTPITKVYETYTKTKPKKEIKTMGSMKSTAQDNGIKEYYSPEEARRFTQAEINSNPALVEAIERSMRKWK
jgi:hypothetical protein